MLLLLVLARTEGGEEVVVVIGGGVKVTRRGANTSEVSTKHLVASRKEGKATSHFSPPGGRLRRGAE